MLVAVPKEILPGETRVGLIPDQVKALTEMGWKVAVESGAGFESGHHDDDYKAAGAEIREDGKALLGEADMVCKVRAPAERGDDHEAALMKKGAVLVCFLLPYQNLDAVKALADAGVTVLAMDLIPRTTLAQSMDVLSSQASLAGYKSVLLAAMELPRYFPMLTTAAGTIRPAKVFVVGAGVAGLQAVATAKRLGAIVEAYDIRPEVKEQVESLGGRFVVLDLPEADGSGEGGYARKMDDAFYDAQRKAMTKHVSGADAVITTAQVPGAKAPVLVTETMMKGMKPGSVVVDLAAEQGGNCELTEAGETTIWNDVRIIGPRNLPASMAHDASRLYSKNIINYLTYLVDDGELNLDTSDEHVSGPLVCWNGKVCDDRVAEAAGVEPGPMPDPPKKAEEPAATAAGGDGGSDESK